MGKAGLITPGGGLCARPSRGNKITENGREVGHFAPMSATLVGPYARGRGTGSDGVEGVVDTLDDEECTAREESFLAPPINIDFFTVTSTAAGDIVEPRAGKYLLAGAVSDRSKGVFAEAGGGGGGRIGAPQTFGCRTESRLARMCCGTMSTLGQAFLIFLPEKNPVVFRCCPSTEAGCFHDCSAGLFRWVMGGRGIDIFTTTALHVSCGVTWRGTILSAASAVPSELACCVVVAEMPASTLPAAEFADSQWLNATIHRRHSADGWVSLWIRPRHQQQHRV